MSELLKKHQQSCDAAESLIGEKLFAPAVHCAYYSCVQLLTYVFLHKIPGINVADFHNTMETQGGTHNYLRKEMKRELLKRQVGRTQADEFANNLLDLKEKRVEADYKDVSISSAESREARRVSEEINTLIKDTFAIAS